MLSDHPVHEQADKLKLDKDLKEGTNLSLITDLKEG